MGYYPKEDKTSFQFNSVTLILVVNIRNIKGVQSRYFELFWPHTKLPALNGRKPENNSLIR